MTTSIPREVNGKWYPVHLPEGGPGRSATDLP
jgi:hypothetical protein